MNIIAILIAGIMSVTGIWSRWDWRDRNWDELAPLLAADGYDTVFYMAAIGPVIDGEGLIECLNACLPLGIDVHAWVAMWRIDCMSEVQQRRMLGEGRIQAYIDGAVIRNRLDPTDPRNVELIAGTALMIAAEYPVTGIHLDYGGCRNRVSGFFENAPDLFLEESSLTYVDWPDDCVPGGQYHERYMEWLTGRMTYCVRTVRDSLNRINRVVQLSAALMPDEREMLFLGRMWSRWLESGLLDLVVTMNFTESDSQFVIWGEEQLELARGNTILCGIGAQSSFSELTEGETLHQIALAEDMGFDGWVIYRLCDEVIHRLQRSFDSDAAGIPGTNSMHPDN